VEKGLDLLKDTKCAIKIMVRKTKHTNRRLVIAQTSRCVWRKCL